MGTPDEAVQLAQAACQAIGDDAGYYGTLAAAYAAAGQFAKAIEAEEKAAALAEKAGNPSQAEQFRRRLALYRAGQPYRDTTAASGISPGLLPKP